MGSDSAGARAPNAEIERYTIPAYTRSGDTFSVLLLSPYQTTTTAQKRERERDASTHVQTTLGSSVIFFAPSKQAAVCVSVRTARIWGLPAAAELWGDSHQHSCLLSRSIGTLPCVQLHQGFQTGPLYQEASRRTMISYMIPHQCHSLIFLSLSMCSLFCTTQGFQRAACGTLCGDGHTMEEQLQRVCCTHCTCLLYARNRLPNLISFRVRGENVQHIQYIQYRYHIPRLSRISVASSCCGGEEEDRSVLVLLTSAIAMAGAG